MKALYLECNMGAAGDMLLAALLELHSDKKAFIGKMNRIGLPGLCMLAEPAVKCGITGTHITVKIHDMEEESGAVFQVEETDGQESRGHGHSHDHSHGHSHGCDHSQNHAPGYDYNTGHMGMDEISEIIEKLAITEKEKADVKSIYRIIAEAESRVHGKPVEQIHFHEVGMLDAIADITGCVMLIHELKVEKIIASPICTGFGQVRCAHGILPVPAPATALILEGVPVYAGRIEGELCTPTGAAVIKYFAAAFEPMPRMTVKRIGYGMGKKDFAAANCIRAVLGEIEGNRDEVIEFCFNIDDMTAEEIGYATEVFLKEGALEVFTTPVGMKKSRPGVLITVMCRKRERDKMAGLIFRHTSTIGIREYTCSRIVLEREERIAESCLGPVRIKQSAGYGITKEKIEYEDLKKIAQRTGSPIRDIIKQIKEEV